MDQNNRYQFKRVKERSISEAMDRVREWRELFQNGLIDSHGNKIKFSLKQAAERVGVPKKTLEDYRQLLKKAGQFIDLELIKDQKMGYLRNFLKNHQQQQQQQMQVGEKVEEEDYYDNSEQEEIKEEYIEQYNFGRDNTDEMIIQGDIRQYYINQYQEDEIGQVSSQVMIGVVTTTIIKVNHNINPILKKLSEFHINSDSDYDSIDETEDEEEEQ